MTGSDHTNVPSGSRAPVSPAAPAMLLHGLFAPRGIERCLVLTLPATMHGASVVPQRLVFSHDRHGRVVYAAWARARPLEAARLGSVLRRLHAAEATGKVRTSLGTATKSPSERVLRAFARAWWAAVASSTKGSSRRALRDALGVFEAGLDATRLDLCPVDRPLRYRAYEWLADCPHAFVPRFAQAVAAYPFLWPLLLELPPEASAALRGCIEQGGPLADVLADLLCVRRWQLRALQRAAKAGHLAVCGIDHSEAIVTAARALAPLAPERVPATREGWRYLACAMRDAMRPDWLRELGESGFDALASGQGLARFWKPLARRSGLRRELARMRDYLDYAGRCTEPGAASDIGTGSLRETLRASRCWQDTVSRDVLAYYYDQALPPWLREDVPAPWAAVGDAAGEESELAPASRRRHDPDEQPWTPLNAVSRIVAGLAFVELTSASALREEGVAMRHCVADYAADCRAGVSRVFSVRDASGRRVSTLELRRADGAWVLGEHAGRCNAAPPAFAAAAADAYVEALRVPRER